MNYSLKKRRFKRRTFMSKKFQFAKGLLTGIVGTTVAVTSAVYAVKKTIIEPEEKKEAFIEENRKKAARRRVSR